MNRAVKTVLLSQVCLYGGLLLCVILKPTGLAANYGISYYGIFRETFIPYALALLGAAYFMVRTIDLIDGQENLLRLAFKTFAPLIAGLVITPYAIAPWVYDLHTTCGTVLFSLQFLLSGWLAWRLRYIWWSLVFVLAELVSGLFSAAYLHPRQGFLLQTQVIFQLAFGILLILSLPRLNPKTLDRSSFATKDRPIDARQHDQARENNVQLKDGAQE